MLFKDIIGQENIKKFLTKTVINGRIPHAQLFVAPQGSGALLMAIAYAQYILCNNKEWENDTGDKNCNAKFKKLIHPDLHFVFPVAARNKNEKHPVSDMYLEEWRRFVKESPYGSLYNWYQLLGIENKQGRIGVDEAENIVKKLAAASLFAKNSTLLNPLVKSVNTNVVKNILLVPSLGS